MLSTERLDVALNPDDDDIVVDASRGLIFVEGADGVAQLIKIGLRLFQEEWFLNLRKGMPWFQEILGEKFNPALIRQRVTEIVLDVYGVVQLQKLDVTSDMAARKIRIAMSVLTKYDDTPIDILATIEA